MFRAFRSRNFRWFILSQSFAMTGSWVQQIALGWLVYRLTTSAFYLGLAATATMLPSLCMAPIAGVIADTFNRRKVIMIVQALSAVQALTLAVLVWSGSVTIGGLLGLSALLGLLQGIDWPARQSLVVHLVTHRGDLGNAIALNSTVFNLARMVGPSLAGVMLAAGGGASAFLVNAVAGGCALVFLAQLRLSPMRRTKPPGKILGNIRDGAAYAWRDPVIRRGIALVALASGCVMPYAALLPLFAAEVFGGGAKLFAMLAMAPAVGAVAGGLLLASRRDHAGLPQRILVVGIVAALSLGAFSLSRSLPLAIASLVTLGGAMMLWTSSINTQLQSVVPEQWRGRVMSLFTIALMGASPLGYLIMGSLAEHMGVAAAVMMGAGLCLAGNLWLHREVVIRPRLLLRKELA